MAFDLRDGIQCIPAFHDRPSQKLDIPHSHFYPGFLAVLASYIHLQNLPKESCTLPNNTYLQTIGFFSALWGEDEQHTVVRRNEGTNYSLMTPLVNVQAVDVATSSINSCIRRLAFPGGGPYPQGVTDLMHVVGELHDNVWSHGRATGFSYAQKSAVPGTARREHYLEFALADHGLGFLKELQRANINGVDTHQQAIAWCIQLGNSSKHADLIDDWAQQIPDGHIGGNVYGASVPVREEQNNHQGLGLAHLMKLINSYNGRLLLASGDVCLVAQGGHTQYRKLSREWQGVALSCRFKISDLASEQQNEQEDDVDITDIMRQLKGE